ncbi:MAG: AMP-dependent acyl-CoA synthetase [Pseudooceanicola sp.]|jgi:acyl-CoA synthetase (AMP-forming)/AMP-acid ligase II|nr:AMP-dependent acyl-CoA synthetase [Pseudooceanicola sp.]
MRLTDYLDKGASLGPEAPCLRMEDRCLSYGEVQRLSHRIARALEAAGVLPGEKVAILSGNDPIAFSCVFGIARAGAVWCPVNPRNEYRENAELLAGTDCKLLIFHSDYAEMVARMQPELTQLGALVCLDRATEFASSFDDWLAPVSDDRVDIRPVDDLVMLPGTGGTTGKPKSVMLTGHNIEMMSALTLMGYPFADRPVYLAVAPLTHAAGVLCFPIMAKGGEIIIMKGPDLDRFLGLISAHRVTHTFLPPTVIYMLLDHPGLGRADLSSLQCFWYGAAPMSKVRLVEALERIGPMGQLFGQTEAPMMISMMAPADHRTANGQIRTDKLGSAGRVAPLVHATIRDPEGRALPVGERGEICVKGPLVMSGYYKNPEATADTIRDGWLHTGDLGYLDAEGFLYIVDRAKDMIITGGFNVYSIEVEQALQSHPSVQDCAVIGLPDDKWGERLVCVVQPRPGHSVDEDAIRAHVKTLIGAVKSPKQVFIWDDLPRSKVGKVVKPEIKAMLLRDAQVTTTAKG